MELRNEAHLNNYENSDRVVVRLRDSVVVNAYRNVDRIIYLEVQDNQSLASQKDVHHSPEEYILVQFQTKDEHVQKAS